MIFPPFFQVGLQLQLHHIVQTTFFHHRPLENANTWSNHQDIQIVANLIYFTQEIVVLLPYIWKISKKTADKLFKLIEVWPLQLIIRTKSWNLCVFQVAQVMEVVWMVSNIQFHEKIINRKIINTFSDTNFSFSSLFQIFDWNNFD